MTSESEIAEPWPVPRIDHVMVLVDRPAYDAVAASRFVRERFGRLKEKHADSSVAGAYSTLGVAGDNTLIELFGTEMPGSAPLTGGLVFSFEVPGSSLAARALLDRSEGVEYRYDLVERGIDGEAEKRPWYHLISAGLGEGSPLLLFLNEVTPEYFAAAGGRPAADGTLRRSDYLDAVLGGRPTDSQAMRDIVGVTLLTGPERARAMARTLAVFGFTVTEDAGGLEVRGPDLTLRLRIDETARERITEIRLRISPERAEPGEFDFSGGSRLVIEANGAARWFFN
ncbi:DUF5829 family protein [Actinomadura sp. 9N407]|uniref:DUF5829 family protein n=1 Tax=Actinomadura sp. 9N407 TaxID=3375154 RepID=UPI0037B7E63D